MSAASLVHNAHLAGLPHYNAGMNIDLARKISGRSDIAALASNENPYGCSPKVGERLRSLDPSRYSDSAARNLRMALAARLGATEDRILVGNGSEEIIANLARAFLQPGDMVLTVAPAFGLHEIQPRSMGATVTKVAMTATCGFDIERLLAELKKGPRLFFLSSPWNPVGTGLTTSELKALIGGVQPGTVFVYDEAYFEFRDHDAPDGIAELSRSGVNWIVLRTFSKAYGLAGLRVGYGLASSAEIARLVDLVRTPFNVNAAAQAAAGAALADDAWMRRHAGLIIAEREALRRGLQAIGLRAAPSQANFLFLDVGRPAKPIADSLLKSGIITKAWTEPPYQDHLRISVGRAEDSARLVDALRQGVD